MDRSAKAVAPVTQTAADLIAEGRFSVRQVAVEDLVLRTDEARYDMAFATRVGALDGRFPHLGAQALRRLAGALIPDGRVFVDGGKPLRELDIPTSPGS